MKRFALVFVVVLVALHLVTPKSVFACTTTPTGRPSYTLEDKVNAAPIILEGTVTNVTQENGLDTATVSVHQYLKGDGSAEVTISNFGSSAMCLTTVRVGDRLIFFAGGDPAIGLRAFYMSAGAAIQASTEDSIAGIRAIVDPSSVTPSPVVTPPAKAAPASSGVGRTLWGVVISLLVLLFR